MLTTAVSITDTSFRINGRLTYSDLPGTNPQAHGLLMNARFIQGIFDDRADPQRFARFGFETWDPEDHTNRLIAALPQWYGFGLRGFTVGFQGGGPCFTTPNDSIVNNPFGTDGRTIDPAYERRMDRLIRAADEVGMVVIVSFLYGDQARRLEDGGAIRRAVGGASRFLRNGGYTNTIVEIANEYSIPPFRNHPIVVEPEGMAWLIDYARDESGGMPVGSSGGGGHYDREVVDASDVVLIHGNGLTRQHFYNMIRTIREWAPDKPIVCNEDSQAIGQLEVCRKTQTSWGYYNNMTKQEPPVRWEVLPGEDRFFATRMAQLIGIPHPDIPQDDQYYLQGFEPEMSVNGMRWPRVAALYPERIDHVDYLRDGVEVYTAYDEPFSMNFRSNWRQSEVEVRPGERWKAVVHLRSKDVLELDETIR